MIAMGRVEEGLQRSVVGEPAEKKLHAGFDSLRQGFLSAGLCSYFSGDGERVREILRIVDFRPEYQRKIAEMLKIEIQIAKNNQQVDLVANLPEPD